MGHQAARKRAIAWGAAALALAGLVGTALPASADPEVARSPTTRQDAPTYAKPTAPTEVIASTVPGGVRVSWTPVTANPPVTRYSIHAGPGSCPVVVPAGATSAVLPVVAGGDFDGFWRATGGVVARVGTRAGLFQPLTSYSLPDAVRFALAVAKQADSDGALLAAFTERRAREHWRRHGFYRMLCAMLFGAAAPIDRYKLLERFYRLDRRLIERFYAGRSTFLDKARILTGKPPVPLGRAIKVISGMTRLPSLTLAGTRK